MNPVKAKRIAIVTGGSGGIGAACAQALAAEGFQIALHYNTNREAAEAIVSDLPHEAFALSADLSSTSGIDRFVDELKDRGPIQVLVNNAGISIDAPLFTASLEDYEIQMNSNLRSAWYLTKKISRMMIRNRSGRIIQISSVVGSTGNIGQSVYSMTKAAMNAMTKSFALELAPYGILVNGIAPGFIDTPMTRGLSEEIREKILSTIPLQRMGNPSEVAEWVTFLSTRASYATGSTYHVNGGLYAGS